MLVINYTYVNIVNYYEYEESARWTGYKKEKYYIILAISTSEFYLLKK